MPLFIFIIKDFSLSLSEWTVLTFMHLVSQSLCGNASGDRRGLDVCVEAPASSLSRSGSTPSPVISRAVFNYQISHPVRSK